MTATAEVPIIPTRYSAYRGLFVLALKGKPLLGPCRDTVARPYHFSTLEDAEYFYTKRGGPDSDAYIAQYR